MTVDTAFIDRVCHDFRGELAVMVMGVHYVLRYDRSLSPDARQTLQRVAGAGARLNKELDEFNDVVWLLGAVPQAPELAPCSLDHVLDTVIERFKSSPRSFRAGVIVEPHPTATECVADTDLLEVALGYVMDISLARSEKEPARITVTQLSGGATLLTVTDTGGAVASEDLERLLEPFAVYAVLPKPATGEPRRERLGLGLSIAARIFEAHGGHLHARGTPGGLALECTFGRAPES
jgi:two-component system, OmpR family, sensor kinase